MGQKKGDGGFAVKDRRSGFALIDNALIDDYGPEIGAYGIAAYCILVRFARADGTDSYPSYQKVASLMNTSRSTAIRTIKKLVDLGLVEKEKRSAKGESISNAYILVNIAYLQNRQEVGGVPQTPPSVPQTPPSVPQTPPSVPQTPPSVTGTPDQYTNNNTPITKHSSSSSSLGAARTDGGDEERRVVKTLSNTLQMAGVGLSQIIVDQYMELVANYGLPAVLAGIQSAVDNNKQHRFKYVATCAANAATGNRPIYPSPNGAAKPAPPETILNFDWDKF